MSVVEDEASILKLIARILNDFGYVVYTANSPKEAVNFVKRHGETIDLRSGSVTGCEPQ